MPVESSETQRLSPPGRHLCYSLESFRSSTSRKRETGPIFTRVVSFSSLRFGLSFESRGVSRFLEMVESRSLNDRTIGHRSHNYFSPSNLRSAADKSSSFYDCNSFVRSYVVFPVLLTSTRAAG